MKNKGCAIFSIIAFFLFGGLCVLVLAQQILGQTPIGK